MRDRIVPVPVKRTRAWRKPYNVAMADMDGKECARFRRVPVARQKVDGSIVEEVVRKIGGRRPDGKWREPD